MCSQRQICVTPLYCTAFVRFSLPSCFDCTNNNRHHKLHLNAKTDGNGPVLVELWPDEV